MDMKVYMQERRSLRKKFATWCLGNKCSSCGETEELEFDHIERSTKKMLIANMFAHGLERLIEELQKCQLLCKECHRLKSLNERGFKDSRTHHTLRRYRNGCRCEECKVLHREAIYSWRQRTGRH